MSKTFFTSDQHFFHKNIRELCPDTRPSESNEDLWAKMIDKWNSTVSCDDHVYLLGDFSFAKGWRTEQIIAQLQGYITLIRGNHDHWADKYWVSKYLVGMSDYKEIKIGGVMVVMCHYPIARWNRANFGSFHLHGHSHGNYTAEGKVLDVGIDARPQKDLGLWEWDEIVAHMEGKELTFHH